MEYLRHLVDLHLIDSSVLEKAQVERDAPDFGIFGAKTAIDTANEMETQPLTERISV